MKLKLRLKFCGKLYKTINLNQDIDVHRTWRILTKIFYIYLSTAYNTLRLLKSSIFPEIKQNYTFLYFGNTVSCPPIGIRPIYKEVAFAYIPKFVFYLIFKHIFEYINYEDTFYSDNE